MFLSNSFDLDALKHNEPHEQIEQLTHYCQNEHLCQHNK